MKSKFMVLAALTLLSFGESVCAQPSQTRSTYPSRSLVDYGGRLGIVVEQTTISYQGSNLLRVVNVIDSSPAKGLVDIGDYIFELNGFAIRSVADFQMITSSGSPGSGVILRVIRSPSYNVISSMELRLLDGRSTGGIPGYRLSTSQAFRPAECAAWLNVAMNDTMPNFLVTETNESRRRLVVESERKAKIADQAMRSLTVRGRAWLQNLIDDYWRSRRDELCATNIDSWLEYSRLSASVQRSIGEALS